MHLFWKPFLLQKDGNIAEENEDSYAIDNVKKGELMRFALADGATEGMLSKMWARILTKAYCHYRNNFDLENLQPFLSRAYDSWHTKKLNYIHQREIQNKPIQWYEEPWLFESGSFSTLLGLTFIGQKDEPAGKWKAVSIGDTCLFYVRGSNLETVFPIKNASEFSNRPHLISSNPSNNTKLNEKFHFANGDFGVDDHFYMMTDALAAWTLREHENGRRPWDFFRDLNTGDQTQVFEDWVRKLRHTRELRNDDTTLLRITVS